MKTAPKPVTYGNSQMLPQPKSGEMHWSSPKGVIRGERPSVPPASPPYGNDTMVKTQTLLPNQKDPKPRGRGFARSKSIGERSLPRDEMKSAPAGVGSMVVTPHSGPKPRSAQSVHKSWKNKSGYRMDTPSSGKSWAGGQRDY